MRRPIHQDLPVIHAMTGTMTGMDAQMKNGGTEGDSEKDSTDRSDKRLVHPPIVNWALTVRQGVVDTGAELLSSSFPQQRTKPPAGPIQASQGRKQTGDRQGAWRAGG